MATEIALLPLKEGRYPDDANSAVGQTWRDSLETVLAQPGAQRAYWGREVENATHLRLFIDWDSIDAHKKFIDSDTYKPFVDRLLTLLDGAPMLYHAHFTPHPPSGALSDTSSPVTEFIHAYFPTSYSDSEKSTFESGVKELISAVENNSKEYTGSAGGWVEEELEIPDTKEKAKVYVALIGWTSVEAHMLFRETQVFKDNIHHLRGAKDLKKIAVVHVPCKEVQQGGGGLVGDAGESGAAGAQEEVLNPQAGSKQSIKSRADGTTTKNAK